MVQPRLVCLLTLALLAVLAGSPLEAVKRLAFVTSTEYNGSASTWEVSGATVLDKADSICRARAAASSLSSVSTNAANYRAWMSTSTTDAYCHVQGLTGKKAVGCDQELPEGIVVAGPWYLVIGPANFTAELERLTGPERVIYRPMSHDENGAQVAAGARYWTGTHPDGTASTTTCSNWSSTATDGTTGHAFGTAQYWTEFSAEDCSDLHRLLCLEAGVSEESILGWSPGQLAFVTSTFGPGFIKGSTWGEDLGGLEGVAAADAICEKRALAGHLPDPDSFVAWLSWTGYEAWERIDLQTSLKRIDAFTVANSQGDLTDGSIDTSLHVNEFGEYLTLAGSAWTGSNGFGFIQDTCTDWMSGSTGLFGTTGTPAYSRFDGWTTGSASQCSNANRLYCFSNVVTIFWDGFDYTGDPSRWSSAVGVP